MTGRDICPSQAIRVVNPTPSRLDELVCRPQGAARQARPCIADNGAAPRCNPPFWTRGAASHEPCPSNEAHGESP